MDTLRTVSLAVALALSTAAFAQTQTPPDQPATESSPPASSDAPASTGTPDPDSASSPHQREATSTATGGETQPGTNPDPAAASSPHQRDTLGATDPGTATAAPKLVGLQVVAPTGEQIGIVTNVMADSASGEPVFIVIAPASGEAGGESKAMPYDAAASMMRDGALVVDSSKLAAAPKVSQNELKDPTQTAWQSEANSYWGTTRAASKDEMQKPKERG